MITQYKKEEQRKTKLDQLTTSSSLASPNETLVSDLQPVQEAIASSVPLDVAPAPMTRQMVERAIVTFFDNGEGAKQRYKIAIRVNLKDENQNESPEFIAPMTKDGRSFRRYSAPGTRDDLVGFHDEMRRYVKTLTDNKPYFGKLHLNNKKWTMGASKIQVEPHCYACIWYDGEGWSGVIKVYDFILPFDLFNNNVTASQAKMNVKSTYLWQNPKYEKKNRPQTWAERRITGIK